MPAAGEPVTPVASGVPTSGGWMYLQPMQVTPSPIKFNHYLYKQSIGLGAAQIVLGSLCIVFNVVSLIVGSSYYGGGLGVIGHGFWCGVMFIITGSFGVSAGVNKTKCKIVSYMVLCIISACFTTVLLSFGIIGAVLSGTSAERCRDYGYSTNYYYYYRPPCSAYVTIAAMEGCMAVCALIAAILFIWGSALCCKAKPCCYNPYLIQQVPLTLNYDSNNGQQVMQPAQFVLPTMPYQPGMPPAYQPSHTQALWTQPQLIQGPPTPNLTQAYGQDTVEGYSPLPNKC